MKYFKSTLLLKNFFFKVGTLHAWLVYMANYPRSLIVYDGSIFHVTWQCHNEDWLLSSHFAKKLYFELLLKYKCAYRMTFFSYCLMDNHIHLTGQCESQIMLSRFFKVVNSCFAKAINKFLKRKGQVVMDRYKSPVIETDEDLMSVITYNDLNPYRTIRKTHPKDYEWSSYAHYAYGKQDPLLTEPEFYITLGNTAKERQKKYRYMTNEIIKDDHRTHKCPY
ncbi:MAG: transposase, partial [bacterium]